MTANHAFQVSDVPLREPSAPERKRSVAQVTHREDCGVCLRPEADTSASMGMRVGAAGPLGCRAISFEGIQGAYQ